MKPTNKNFKDSINNSSAGADQVNLDDGTATHVEQSLLKALQGFILPHIEAAVDANYQQESVQRLTGPQAKMLITALKEFISSLVGMSAKMESETTISVDLDKDDSMMATKAAPVDSQEAEGADIYQCPLNYYKAHSGISLVLSHPAPPDSFDVSVKDYAILSMPALAFHEKVLRNLHRRVFNKMPIRLLCFVKKGALLEISLKERAGIYEHVVSVLQEKQGDAEYRPITVPRQHGLFAEGLESEDEAIQRIIKTYAGYAILSHTWLRQSPELTYGNWKSGLFDSESLGYLKLVNFCKAAYENHKLTLGWMDTVCINKDSSSELDESIRSMYIWYKRSTVCIVHLAETESLPEMHFDPWFTRGWTLQELIGPIVLKFYNRRWKRIVDADNDKMETQIMDKITQATSITMQELIATLPQGVRQPMSLSRRMQLAAQRKVTREEDTAYSLMGLFGVNIPTAYGEGADRAFFRLLQEILNIYTDDVLDIFNWAGICSSSSSTILPRGPHQYLARASGNLRFYQPIEPLTWTHMGIRIPVILMPGISRQEGTYIKPCGDYGATVFISHLSATDVRNPIPTAYNLLQQQETRPDSVPWHFEENYRFTFAVFNVTKDKEDIVILPKCIAIPLACVEDTGKVSSTGRYTRIYTKEPVVFNMLERNLDQDNELAEDYMVKIDEHRAIIIPQQDLAKHGMQLVFKYL